MKIVSITEDRNLCTTTIVTEWEPGDPPEPPTRCQRMLMWLATMFSGTRTSVESLLCQSGYRVGLSADEDAKTLADESGFTPESMNSGN